MHIMKFDLRAPENRHWLWALYLPVYLAAFFWIESYITPQSDYWVSYWPLVDDAIPFCPPFVLAYYAWFPFLVCTGLYLGFRDGACFRRYMQFIALGFTFSLVFFLIFPNGQDLRPTSFEKDTLFTRMIAAIYAADTNTNVLPSIHALGSFAAVFAAYDCPAFKPWLRKAYVVIALLICASTVFIKQHSILDTLAGLILCLPFYWMVYGFHSKGRAKA